MESSVRLHLCVYVAGLFVGAAGAAEPVRFGRDILPILSENCFACHGPDEAYRAAELRLDTRDGALAVIDLEAPDESELIVRIVSTDPDVRMPPPSAHKKPLTLDQ